MTLAVDFSTPKSDLNAMHASYLKPGPNRGSLFGPQVNPNPEKMADLWGYRRKHAGLLRPLRGFTLRS